jgi:hypothetical protein
MQRGAVLIAHFRSNRTSDTGPRRQRPLAAEERRSCHDEQNKIPRRLAQNLLPFAKVMEI